MSTTININKLSLCHRASGGFSAATLPDVCLTPPDPTPVPYPNIATEQDLAKGTTTVAADGGNMCANYGSEFSRSTGDEPGSAGGVASGTFMKEATWITYSFDVKLEGKGACRLTDKMFHNHQNTINAGGDIHNPVRDCKTLAAMAKEGDIVLRSTPGSDSDLIRKLGRCDYSHAGIVTKNAAGDLVVVDAYPGRGPGNKNAVGQEPLESFFCGTEHGPPDKGLVARPTDQAAAKKASEWAQQQTKNPDYHFDIFNDWKSGGNDVYCADFVHRAYQNAGMDLVPDKMDFLSDANKQNTIDGVRQFKPGLKFASDSKVEDLISSQMRTSEYITPCQVATNPMMSTVEEFP